MVHRSDGDRDLLRPLFREADDSDQQLDAYLDLGAVFVAEDDGEIIGHLGDLRFYQRQGFRMLRIERDAFVPSTGYPDEILIDGIALRDRVWLSQDL
jgi:hypothetical protein